MKKVRAKRNLKGNKGRLRDVCASLDGERLASVDEKGNLRIGSIWESEPEHVVQAFRSFAMTCLWHERGVWTGDTSGTLVLWDPVTGDELERMSVPDVGVLDQLVLSPSGDYAISRHQNTKESVLWDFNARTGRKLPFEGSSTALALSDTQWVVQVSTGVVQILTEGGAPTAEIIFTGWVHSMALSKAKDRVAFGVFGKDTYEIVLCDSTTLEVLDRIDDFAYSSIMALQFVHDDAVLLVRCMSGPVSLISLDTKEVLSPSLKEGAFPVGQAAAMCARGRFLVVGAGQALQAFDLEALL